MGFLHLVPYVMLFSVTVWLIWPAWIEPAFRRTRALRRPRAEPADKVAEVLFGTWRDHGAGAGLVDPTRR